MILLVKNNAPIPFVEYVINKFQNMDINIRDYNHLGALDHANNINSELYNVLYDHYQHKIVDPHGIYKKLRVENGKEAKINTCCF